MMPTKRRRSMLLVWCVFVREREREKERERDTHTKIHLMPKKKKSGCKAERLCVMI
jgi:hypothetical protein